MKILIIGEFHVLGEASELFQIRWKCSQKALSSAEAFMLILTDFKKRIFFCSDLSGFPHQHQMCLLLLE